MSDELAAGIIEQVRLLEQRVVAAEAIAEKAQRALAMKGIRFDPEGVYIGGPVDVEDDLRQLTTKLHDLQVELAAWKAIAYATARCPHGRLHGDACLSCQDKAAPDMTGVLIGHDISGLTNVRIPARGDMDDVSVWFTVK